MWKIKYRKAGEIEVHLSLWKERTCDNASCTCPEHRITWPNQTSWKVSPGPVEPDTSTVTGPVPDGWGVTATFHLKERKRKRKAKLMKSTGEAANKVGRYIVARTKMLKRKKENETEQLPTGAGQRKSQLSLRSGEVSYINHAAGAWLQRWSVGKMVATQLQLRAVLGKHKPHQCQEKHNYLIAQRLSKNRKLPRPDQWSFSE